MTREALVKKRASLIAKIPILRGKIKAIEADLSINCQHEDTYDTKEANDNGYGSWWYTHYRVCNLCGHKERTGRSDYK